MTWKKNSVQESAFLGSTHKCPKESWTSWLQYICQVVSSYARKQKTKHSVFAKDNAGEGGGLPTLIQVFEKDVKLFLVKKKRCSVHQFSDNFICPQGREFGPKFSLGVYLPQKTKCLSLISWKSAETRRSFESSFWIFVSGPRKTKSWVRNWEDTWKRASRQTKKNCITTGFVFSPGQTADFWIWTLKARTFNSLYRSGNKAILSSLFALQGQTHVHSMHTLFRPSTGHHTQNCLSNCHSHTAPMWFSCSGVWAP